MIIKVGMGEGVVIESPHIIKSAGLGSCVALTLYDTKQRIGGLSHIMMPKINSPQSPLNIRGEGRGVMKFQSADTAILVLMNEMIRKGATMLDIVAKIAGGARMFPSYSGISTGIGEQNIISIKQLLKKKGIPLIGEDTGWDYGRSVEFYLDSGRVIVKAFGKEDKEI